jgi:hypothetical protein
MKLRAALCFVALLFCQTARARDVASTPRTADAMAQAAARFIASLDDEQRAKAVMAFDDPRRLEWFNIPLPDRKGLQLRELSDEQQKLCHDLLKSALSETGYEKAVKILALENNLHEGEKNRQGGPIRDPERYYVTIYGKPGERGQWGWSFEGHHYCLNFTIADGQVIGDTPDFWGANPATVHTFVEGGPKEGARTLAEEEQLAFDLLDSLDDAQRKVAVVSDKAPDEYRNPASPQPPQAAPEGLPAAKMTQEQQKILHKLLGAYCSRLAEGLAAARISKIELGGFDEIHFAWYGEQKPGAPHAYRVQGPTFVLEFVNVQTDPEGHIANHIHTIWRNLEGDFGVKAE